MLGEIIDLLNKEGEVRAAQQTVNSLEDQLKRVKSEAERQNLQEQLDEATEILNNQKQELNQLVSQNQNQVYVTRDAPDGAERK